MAKRIFLATVLGASAFSLSACDASTEPESDPGTLRMGLVGQDAEGNVYRLRDALFDIDGPESASLSTETSPSPQDTLALELAAGDYGIFLNDGWRLERWDPMTDATLDMTATLTSVNPASTLITGTETSTVVFTFLVDDAGPVSLGDGDLVIDIDVDVDVDEGEPLPPPPPCEPLNPSCEPDQACYPYGDSPQQFTCAPMVDAVGVYASCAFINNCEAGLLCASTAANNNCNADDTGCCLAYCDRSAPVCGAGETCEDLGSIDPNVGVCVAL